MRVLPLKFVVVVACLGALAAAAADGDLDATFGTSGQVMTDFRFSTDIANAVAVQPDGKIIVVGTTYTNNDYSEEDFAVARYNADGTLDATFGVDGRVTTDFPGLAAVASSVVVQPDGKIVVAGGAFPLFTFLGEFKLVRYNPDGTLDATFGSGGIVTTDFPGQGSYAFAVALQPDGKIVAAGTQFINFSSDASSNTDFALARYHADGSPDTSFGTGGRVTADFDGLNDDVFAVLVQPDGKLVAVGSARNAVSDYDFALARFLPNGALDTAFGSGGKVRTDIGLRGFDRAHSAALQPDGKVVAAGFAIARSGANENFALARYGANGALDTTFSGDGKVQVDFGSCCQAAQRVLLQADGKIVVVGYPDSESTDSDFLLARLLPNGALDTSFGGGGKVRTSFGDLNGGARGAALQADGRIVAAGFQATNTPRWAEFALARYLVGGSGGGISLLTAVSRKTHGGAGAFDVALPLAGEPGVECRNDNGRHTLVFIYSGNVVAGSAAVTAGVGSVQGSPVFFGNTMTVNLSGVADAQKLTVRLSGVTGAEGQSVPDASVSVNLLAGDVGGDKAVQNADVMQTRAQLGATVTASNFRADVRTDGTLDAQDVAQVRARLGHSVP
jgi:uncharacterized delta-60 repeat protein